MNFGVLYVATGEKFCKEAIENARRSRFANPGLSISIKTDQVSLALESKEFNSVISFDCPVFGYRDKIMGLFDLPYEKTLFLDSDACLIDEVSEFSDLLDYFDLAAVSAPVRHPPGWTDLSVPRLLSELNTGVLLIRRKYEWTSFVDSWLTLYDACLKSHQQSWDQATFRSVLWSHIQQSNYRFFHLPIEANLRTTKPWIAGRGLAVQVIHGRYPDHEFTKFVNYLNDDIDRFRTWGEWISLYPETVIRPRFDRTFG